MEKAGKYSLIEQSTIDAVKELDLADVIGDRVILKKRGSRLVGLCPFHSEKTPSFTVSNNLYHCFGCGESGDGIKFFQRLDTLSFSESVLEIAKNHNIAIEYKEQTKEAQLKRTRNDLILDAISSASDRYYEAGLKNQNCIKFLKDRGIRKNAIDYWKIGYSPSKTFIYDSLKEIYPIDVLTDAGLVIKSMEGDVYDRFAYRVIIPIANEKGVVVGFTGRSIGDRHPKYLNSSASNIFDKSSLIFGLNHAKKDIKKLDQAILVEGHFDVINLWQHGITNAIAAQGTAININQINKIARYTDNIILNLDSDKAGIAATNKIIQLTESLINEELINLRIVEIHEKDPDECIKIKGIEEYKNKVTNSVHWIEWKLKRSIAEFNLKDSHQFSKAVKSCHALLDGLKNQNLKVFYNSYCIDLLAVSGIPKANLVKLFSNKPISGKKTETVKEIESIDLKAEKMLFQILLHIPLSRFTVIAIVDESGICFKGKNFNELWNDLLDLFSKIDPLEESGIDLLPDKYKDLLTISEVELLLLEPYTEVAKDCINTIRSYRIKETEKEAFKQLLLKSLNK